MKNLQVPDSVEREVIEEAESSVNLSYQSALNKEGIKPLSKEEFKFMRAHMTSENESRAIELMRQAEALDRGLTNVSERTKDRLEEVKVEGETYVQAAIKLSRRRLLPYYKRYTPVGIRP